MEIPEGRSDLEVYIPADIFADGEILLKKGDAKLSFFKTSYFIEVQMTISSIVEMVCFRSLETFDFSSESEYRVLFKDQATDIADEHVAERPFTQYGEAIDLTQDVRDTILLSLPAQPLHPRFHDENGEPVDFGVYNIGTPEIEPHKTDIVDHRWKKLEELKDQLNRSDSELLETQ